MASSAPAPHTRHGLASVFSYALTPQAKPPRRGLTQGVPAVIVYQASKRQFIHDTFQDSIEFKLSEQYLRTTGRQPAPAEFKSWENSLFRIGKVLRDEAIPDDMGVALAYTVPQTSKRIDVLLTGEDEAGAPKLVIIELKQWSEARFSEKDGIVWARRGGKAGETEGAQCVHATEPTLPAPPSAKVLPLRRVSDAERAQGVPAVPGVSLKFAAGSFSDPQALEDSATEWVELLEWVKPQPGLFVAQVVGESMNKRIPNGAWCLFRANPQGTRNGKIVVVQHRSISDPETGGSCTVKRYRSEKVVDADGAWRHERIELVPESDGVGFEVMTVQPNDVDALSVIAEWLMVVAD